MSFEKLVICATNGGNAEEAATLAERIGAVFSRALCDGLTLLFDENGVSLTDGKMSFRGDFERMLRRFTNGRLPHEMLVHAAKTKAENPRAIDATAGMGEDSLLFAASGYEVTMYEKDPVIAALLRDALRRAEKSEELKEIVGRMKLIEGDSTELMPKTERPPELIYLDPMFPKRTKSGLINKKLQLIQKIERPCADEKALLAAAEAASPRKIVVKRPLKGAFLADKTPNYSVKGRAIRYDCFVFPNR